MEITTNCPPRKAPGPANGTTLLFATGFYYTGAVKRGEGKVVSGKWQKQVPAG